MKSPLLLVERGNTARVSKMNSYLWSRQNRDLHLVGKKRIAAIHSPHLTYEFVINHLNELLGLFISSKG